MMPIHIACENGQEEVVEVRRWAAWPHTCVCVHAAPPSAMPHHSAPGSRLEVRVRTGGGAVCVDRMPLLHRSS